MTNHFEPIIPKVLNWINAQSSSTPWIFLYGDLGAGKTTFTRELLSRLGFPGEEIQSPTFLKVLTYTNKDGETALHMDAYRIEIVEEFLKVGLENIDEIKVGIVEWPEKFEQFLKKYPTFKSALEIDRIMKIKLPAVHNISNVELVEE